MVVEAPGPTKGPVPSGPFMVALLKLNCGLCVCMPASPRRQRFLLPLVSILARSWSKSSVNRHFISQSQVQVVKC